MSEVNENRQRQGVTFHPNTRFAIAIFTRSDLRDKTVGELGKSINGFRIEGGGIDVGFPITMIEEDSTSAPKNKMYSAPIRLIEEIGEHDLHVFDTNGTEYWIARQETKKQPKSVPEAESVRFVERLKRLLAWIRV